MDQATVRSLDTTASLPSTCSMSIINVPIGIRNPLVLGAEGSLVSDYPESESCSAVGNALRAPQSFCGCDPGVNEKYETF